MLLNTYICIQLLTELSLLKEKAQLLTQDWEKAFFGSQKNKGGLIYQKSHSLVCLYLHPPQPTTTLSPGESESWLDIFTCDWGVIEASPW